MNKTATHSTASAETTTKGAYMVYDHAEDELQSKNSGISISAAAIELASLICLTGVLIAITFM